MNEAQELVAIIVSSITGEPDCFKVEQSIDENGGLLTLTVDQAQAGRVLGKKGSMAESIRTILKGLGMKNNHRYHLKVVVNE